jgi:hypothetical protein
LPARPSSYWLACAAQAPSRPSDHSSWGSPGVLRMYPVASRYLSSVVNQKFAGISRRLSAPDATRRLHTYYHRLAIDGIANRPAHSRRATSGTPIQPENATRTSDSRH